MGFNSAFKGLKLFKKPGNGRLNNLNDPVLNVLTERPICILTTFHFNTKPADLYALPTASMGLFLEMRNVAFKNGVNCLDQNLLKMTEYRPLVEYY
jgi:hypothetical protein